MILRSLFVAFVSASLLSCSDGETRRNLERTPDCSAYIPSPGVDLTTPATFTNEVHTRVIGKYCSATNCHGGTGFNQGIYLGVDKDISFAGLSKKSQALPTMPYVTPGDPANSFLMRKLDGDMCALNAQCKDGNCGVQMPNSFTDQRRPLPDDERLSVRRWILQGAKND